MIVSPFNIFLINQKKSTLSGLWDIELKKLSNFDKSKLFNCSFILSFNWSANAHFVFKDIINNQIKKTENISIYKEL